MVVVLPEPLGPNQFLASLLIVNNRRGKFGSAGNVKQGRFNGLIESISAY
jgi:hypothetical protein